MTAKLIACPDCGKQVSRRADACPGCGRRMRSRQTAGGLLAAIVIGLILCWVIVTFVVPRLGVN